MNVDENQDEQLLSHLSDTEITEETPLTDTQPHAEEEEEIIPCISPEVYDWNTSLISRVSRFNQTKYL